MRVIVCGPRRDVLAEFVDNALDQIHDDLYEGERMIVVHGQNFDRPDSADKLADDWTQMQGPNVRAEPFPADWSRGRRGGPERNRRMAEAGADLCLAFGRMCHCREQFNAHMTHGTASMVNEALRAEIEVRIIPL